MAAPERRGNVPTVQVPVKHQQGASTFQNTAEKQLDRIYTRDGRTCSGREPGPYTGCPACGHRL